MALPKVNEVLKGTSLPSVDTVLKKLPTVEETLSPTDRKLKKLGLPTSKQLKAQNIDPEFSANHPLITKGGLGFKGFIDKVLGLPGINFIDRNMYHVADTVSMGGVYGKAPSTGNKTLDKIADFTGPLAGFALAPRVPGLPAGEALNAGKGIINATENTLARHTGRVLPKVDTVLGMAKRGFATGATAGGIYGTAETMVTGKPLRETLPGNVAGFVAGEALLGPLLSKAANRGIPWKNLQRPPMVKPEIKPIETKLNVRGNKVPTYNYSNITVDPYGNAVKEARPVMGLLPSPVKLDGVEQQFLDSVYKQGTTLDNVLKMVQGKRDQKLNEQLDYLLSSGKQGVNQGQLVRDELGNVTNRIGRVSNNPKWYKDFYAANGRAPNKKEMQQLATEHLTKGFDDELGGYIPADAEFTQLDGVLGNLKKLQQKLAGKSMPESVNTVSKTQKLKPLFPLKSTKNIVIPDRPEDIAALYNTKKWYHGTGKDNLTKDTIDPLIGSHESLFGQGVYLTDSPKIAKGYAKSRGKRTGTPATYETKVNINKVIDLEKPITSDVAKTIEDSAYNDFKDVVRQSSLKPGATPESVIKDLQEAVKEHSFSEGYSTNEYVEMFQDLAINLKRSGYDGITHTGGLRTGKDPHKVLIMLDPGDIYAETGRINQINKFEKFIPKKLPSLNKSLKPQSIQPNYASAVGTKETFGRPVRMQAKELPIPNKDVAATNEFNLGNADTFRQRVSRDVKPKKGSFRETFDKVRTQFVDDLAPAEKAERAVRGGKLASAENSLYKQARLFKGNPTKANEIVRTRLAPIIDSVEKQGYSYKDLGDYALAIHARDVEKLGIETGFKPSEIDDVIRKFGTPEIEAARQEMLKLNNDLLDDLVDSGRLSQELVDGLKKKYPNYMSLFRNFDDEKVEFTQGLSKTLANVASPIQWLKGSEREVIDPIESMIKNTFKITSSSDRNRVARQLLSLADEDTAGSFVRRLADGEDTGRKNVLKVFEGGKEIKVEVEPELYKAMLNLDQESADLFIRIMQKPAALLRAGATLTPEFSLRNPMRDVLQAFVTSNSKFNPIIDFPAGLMGAIFKGRSVKVGGKEFKLPGELYEQFLKDNGGYGNVVSMDRKLHREVLESTLKQPASKKFVNILSGKSFINMLRAISDTTETATKLGEYRAAIRSGATRPEAAYRARDLMDFARAGSSTRNLNRIVAFLNANIQGKSKIIRAFKENPAGVTARGAAAITIPTIGVYAAQKYLANEVQKQEINDAPGWLKSTFWLIPVPGTDQVARIPKPFDLAFIFANPVERMMEYIDKNDPEAFDGFMKETLSNAAIPTMLTGLAPIVEGMANYSFFRQGPIIPEREKNLRYQDQYDINTTETAKGIAKGIGKVTGGEGTFKNFSSPRVVDNTIQGLTAGLGRYATNGIDVLLEGMGTIKKPEKPTKAPGQIPVLRAFLMNQSSTGKSVDELYKERDRLTRDKGSAKLNKEPFKHLPRLKMVERVTGIIGDISKRMRAIENSPTLSGTEKRKRLDELNKLRNKIARETMQKLKQ